MWVSGGGEAYIKLATVSMCSGGLTMHIVETEKG